MARSPVRRDPFWYVYLEDTLKLCQRVAAGYSFNAEASLPTFIAYTSTLTTLPIT